MNNKKDLENVCRQILTNRPQPKYQLFQETAKGLIVGIRFDSVAGCINGEGIYPGFWYYVEDSEDFTTQPCYEDEIQLIQANG
jgi:hypothetical protein